MPETTAPDPNVTAEYPAENAPARIPAGPGDIFIRGARQHNLKDVDVRIPRHHLVVITGVSGSGKSSLALDTLYAEGQRRYVESLSAYARQFLAQMEKPLVDQITGLSPAIAIEQKTVSKNPRSTVGTVTEILDYLRVLYARAGTPHCPECGREVRPQSVRQMVERLLAFPAGTRFELLAPVVRGRKGTHKQLLRQALQDGYRRARVDGETLPLDTVPPLDKKRKHTVELVVDRLQAPAEPDAAYRRRLADSVETCLAAAAGLLIAAPASGEPVLFSRHHACPHCELSLPELAPQLFSFNSPQGMCPECHGLGVQLQVDPALIITRPELSLLDGACRWYGELRKKPESSWGVTSLRTIAAHYGVDLELPWCELPQKFRHVLLYGSGGEKIRFNHDFDTGTWESEQAPKGIIFHINRLFRQTKSEGQRRRYLSFMSQQPCPVCRGERLCAPARFVTVGGQRLPEVVGLSVAGAAAWVASLPPTFDQETAQIAAELVKEIGERLRFMLNVGLHYLTLDRPAPTLSGGEAQRIRLASQLGCGLVGVLYILDEPSIGLHARDQEALLHTLCDLRDLGNTVVVIEHDEATMRAADWLIDLGPGAGVLGGELLAAGPPAAVMANPRSLTGRYLRGELQVTSPNGNHVSKEPRSSATSGAAQGTRFLSGLREPAGWLALHGACLHNLKEITARIPLGTFTCITGVSGSGKSSLVTGTLHPLLARELHNAQAVPGPYRSLEGLAQIDKVIHITQDPIGRTPRSNPATYVKVFGAIRRLFASLPEARARGYRAGRFSFNKPEGRCPACKGYGRKKVEMHFLADVWVVCRACGGQRYNPATLEVAYQGHTIAGVLELDVQQALELFANHPKIGRHLQTLHDVGLDYLKLGQSALTLSGGEAQRVKLAKELSRASTGRTLYILDEPTTGLHFADIQRLLDVLHRLVDAGNTVVVIEHNLDVIRSADWLIDLGPEGGDAGGYVVAEGPPPAVAQVPGSWTGRYL